MPLPSGTLKAEYFQNPRIDRPLDQIFADIDSWTYEVFEGNEGDYHRVDLTVVLPPLQHKQISLKGLCFSRGVDLLLSRHPSMAEHFVTIAASMCSAYAWSTSADALFATYNNPVRDAWFRATYPERARQTLLPVSDADFLNEQLFTPRPQRKKTIDVLTVSRLEYCKNLPMLCQAIAIYNQTYKEPIKLTIIAGRPSGNLKNLSIEESDTLKNMEHVLKEKMSTHVEVVPHVTHGLLPYYYASAKVTVLGSLIEGANRSLKESMSCDTPVVCFKDFNAYSRGSDSIFPDGAGRLADFCPEALSRVFHEIIHATESFSPRQQFLHATGGRAGMADTCLRSLGYYRENLPNYQGSDFQHNSWIVQAMHEQYGMSPLDWIYAKSPLVHTDGLDKVDATLQYFLR